MRQCMDVHTFKRAYSVAEFAAAYGICRAQVYVEIKTGRLAARKIGRRSLISIEEAQRWFAALPEFGAGVAR